MENHTYQRTSLGGLMGTDSVLFEHNRSESQLLLMGNGNDKCAMSYKICISQVFEFSLESYRLRWEESARYGINLLASFISFPTYFLCFSWDTKHKKEKQASVPSFASILWFLATSYLSARHEHIQDLSERLRLYWNPRDEDRYLFGHKRAI